MAGMQQRARMLVSQPEGRIGLDFSTANVEGSGGAR
jgi:hypothetical protein